MKPNHVKSNAQANSRRRHRRSQLCEPRCREGGTDASHTPVFGYKQEIFGLRIMVVVDIDDQRFAVVRSCTAIIMASCNISRAREQPAVGPRVAGGIEGARQVRPVASG